MTNILITNIEGQPGMRIVQALGAAHQGHIIGMGRQAPALSDAALDLQVPPLSGYELVDFLRTRQVDTVIHLDIEGEDAPSHSSETALQRHVLDSMLLLGSCLAAGVRRVVVRSSTLVYGARPDNPAFLHEGRTPARIRQPGLIRNYHEADAFATDFARQHPEMQIMLLRCASLAGGGVWSPLAHYLAHPAPRMLLGFNPRIQVLHPDDAAAAFALAARHTASGAVNLAAADPLPLAQAIRLAGKQPAPLPGMLLRTTDWPYGRDFLRYSCVGDTRRARAVLAWEPTYSARSILRELATNEVRSGTATDAPSPPCLEQEPV